jgi:hypothetical protein
LNVYFLTDSGIVELSVSLRLRQTKAARQWIVEVVTLRLGEWHREGVGRELVRDAQALARLLELRSGADLVRQPAPA